MNARLQRTILEAVEEAFVGAYQENRKRGIYEYVAWTEAASDVTNLVAELVNIARDNAQGKIARDQEGI